jgi:Fe-S cluster assembly ATPase SufC
MMDGRIVKTGGPELANTIEREGYDRIREEIAPAVLT